MDENSTPLAATIEEMAELQFTDGEIAIIVGMPVGELVQAHRDTIDRGRLRAEAEVRRAEYQLAKQGSTPAIAGFRDANTRAKRSRRTST